MTIYLLVIAVVLKTPTGVVASDVIGAYRTKKECDAARKLEDGLKPNDKKALRGSACVKVF